MKTIMKQARAPSASIERTAELPLNSAADIRMRMQEDDGSFLAVVRPDPQKLLEVVTLDGAEPGCAAERHERGASPITRRLEIGTTCSLEEEVAEEVLRVDDGWRTATYGFAKSPIVPVNAPKTPAGYLKR